MPNEKTKAALKGYVMALVNETSANIEQALPTLRGAIESDNEDVIEDTMGVLAENLRALLSAVQHRDEIAIPSRRYGKRLRVDSDELRKEASPTKG
jgi:hypothetical protein